LAFRREKLQGLHTAHFEWLKSHVSEVEEQDFRIAPEPKEWILFPRSDQRKGETLERWNLRLRQFVERAGGNSRALDGLQSQDTVLGGGENFTLTSTVRRIWIYGTSSEAASAHWAYTSFWRASGLSE
jgi:hypothetical protein